MQLKAQNPTLGNEATGTEQAALQRLDAGMGLAGCLVNPCQEQDTAAPAANQHLCYSPCIQNLEKVYICQVWETG